MIAEQYNSSDDTLARLQNIHGMFDSLKASVEDKPKLVKQEKTDPSEKLLEKLNVYENCDGSVDEKQIEKLRKEYFEGLQFNTLQTALELFQNPAAEARTVKEPSTSTEQLVSKGTIGDIRSVFINAITSDDTIDISDSLNDEQWLSSSNESRIRKLLTLSLPYLRSYQEMADDTILDILRNVFSNVAADLEKQSLSTIKDITDRQWFWGINEDRVEQLLQKAVDKSNQIAKDQINADMWCKIRAAFMHCVSSTAALYNKHSKAKTDFSDIGSVQGLTDSKIEQILAETTKEYRRKNKELDVKVVEGITAELKNQIQAAITQQSDKERRKSQSDAEKPEKLSPERLNKIIAEVNKQAHVKSSEIDPALFEGLTSTIKERIMQEINKEQKINRTVESIDVEPGTASSARQKLMEAYEEDRTRTSSQSTPQSIDKERLDMFTRLAETQEGRTTEWVPDVEVQKGLAQERVRSLMQAPSERAETDWTPDVPISSGFAKERASLLTGPKDQDSNARIWTPEVLLESGLTKDRAAQIVAAAAQPQTTSQWVPDVPVTSGVVGQRAESFLKDNVVESRDWKPDIELTPGLTKERIKNLYEDRHTVDEHVESKDVADLIHAGLAKERLNEFTKPSEAKQAKEWEPEVELRKGLTKERTSLFHNLEALQNQTTSSSAERPKVPLLGTGGQRVVVEVENEPLPQDPNVTRGGVGTEQAQVEAGFTKLIINKLKNAYDADEEKKNALKSNQNIREELAMNEGHAKNLRAKFSGFEQDAKTIHTTAEKQTHVPRRFVDKPAPTPIPCEIVTEEKCLCCKQPVYSTEGIKIQKLGYVHKKCMRCPRCNKIPPIAEAVFQNGHIFCTEHKEANV